MILGRSTVQWTALITSAGALAQVLIVQLVPDVDSTLVATLIGSVAAFLGVFIAFLANTRTTPISDPILEAGTTVRVLNSEDSVVIQPSPPGPTGIEGGPDGGIG